MSKVLEVILNTEGGGTTTVSIKNPKEGLTLAEVQEKAEQMVPVFRSASNNPVVSFKKARIVNTETEELK